MTNASANYTGGARNLLLRRGSKKKTAERAEQQALATLKRTNLMNKVKESRSSRTVGISSLPSTSSKPKQWVYSHARESIQSAGKERALAPSSIGTSTTWLVPRGHVGLTRWAPEVRSDDKMSARDTFARPHAVPQTDLANLEACKRLILSTNNLLNLPISSPSSCRGVSPEPASLHLQPESSLSETTPRRSSVDQLNMHSSNVPSPSHSMRGRLSSLQSESEAAESEQIYRDRSEGVDEDFRYDGHKTAQDVIDSYERYLNGQPGDTASEPNDPYVSSGLGMPATDLDDDIRSWGSADDDVPVEAGSYTTQDARYPSLSTLDVSPVPSQTSSAESIDDFDEAELLQQPGAYPFLPSPYSRFRHISQLDTEQLALSFRHPCMYTADGFPYGYWYEGDEFGNGDEQAWPLMLRNWHEMWSWSAPSRWKRVTQTESHQTGDSSYDAKGNRTVSRVTSGV